MNTCQYHITELPKAAEWLFNLVENTKIVVFRGNMGAGKTTFIKAFCHFLGVTSHVSSPTYSLVNTYKTPTLLVYHFDFYRLKSENEALDFGVEEYFDSGNWCLLEWAEKIPTLLPIQYGLVEISLFQEDIRTITFQHHG